MKGDRFYMVYVFLAEGFEEMEAIAPIDLLRRAGCKVVTVAVGDRLVSGAHGIPVQADITADQVVYEDVEAVILPGGMPGTLNLEASDAVQQMLDYAWKSDLVIGAICAAPSVLGHKGFLEGKCAVCYPGFEKELRGATISAEPVAVDGRIVTAKGAGVGTEFGLALVEMLVSAEAAQALREGIQCK